MKGKTEPQTRLDDLKDMTEPIEEADLFGSEEEEVEPQGDGAIAADQEPNAVVAASKDENEHVAPERAAATAMQLETRVEEEDLEDHDMDLDEEPQQQNENGAEHHENLRIMQLEAPLVNLPAPNSLHLIRTTNIIGIERNQFDPITYKPEQDQDGVKMRWRVRDDQGQEVRESNARFVQWSDGSLQLLIGDEVLDVMKQDISQNNNYLFQLAGASLQGQAHLSSRLALRPASLDSELHKRIRDTVAKVTQGRGNKVVAQGGLVNPEADKARKEAAEEAQIRSKQQLQKKQDQAMRKSGFGGRPFPGSSRPVRLSASYLEEEDEDAWGMGNHNSKGDADAEEEEEEEEEGDQRGFDEDATLRLQTAKRPLSQDDDQALVSRKRTRRGGPIEEEELLELPEAGEGEEEDMLPEDEEEFVDYRT